MEEGLIQITIEVVQNLFRTKQIELSSTHNKLCLPIINRLYKKMMIGIRFSGIKVSDGVIIDGHHRYLASQLANIELERLPSSKTSATTIIDWESVVFATEDWDTEAKIKMLNEEDARYNNVPLEEIAKLM